MSGFLDWLSSDSASVVAFSMVMACTIVTLLNVVMHLMYYNRDELQRHIIRIVLVVPIYTIASYLEMKYPSTAIITHAIVGFWEALVIYSFFNLILEYVGGEHNWLVCVARTHPEGLSHMWPFHYIFPKKMDLDPSWLRRCKLACFQFVLIKPVFGLLLLPVLIYGSYHNAAWKLARDIIYNITYTIAMYALALLYLTTHEHPSLESKRPLAKFVAVKIVIFFTYWQKYLLMLFGLSETQLSDLLSFLTMVEMTLMAIPLNWIAFPYWEFKQPEMKVDESLPDLEIPTADPATFSQFKHRSMKKIHSVMGNAAKVFSPDDMVDNAEHNILSKYQTHVLLQSSQDYVLEENPDMSDLSSIMASAPPSPEAPARSSNPATKSRMKPARDLSDQPIPLLAPPRRSADQIGLE
jgi:hypothetical protein